MKPLKLTIVTVAAVTLAACGGSDGGVNSTPYFPKPTPTPTPPPSPLAGLPDGAHTAFDIIENAPTGEFAVSGASAEGYLGDPEMLANASLAGADQPQVRYDGATDTYQVMLPGESWGTLWTIVDASSPDVLAIGNSGNIIGFNLYPPADDGFSYSTIAWYSGPGEKFGRIAFGVPTPVSAVPTSGAATYEGIVSGETDIFQFEDGGFPGYSALGVGGTVTLKFDFSDGTLGGSMEPILGSESLGVFTFTDGVYSAGSYSGTFDTSVSGINGFNGELTGPHGEELIGGWALPFHYKGDDQDHQAIGAWIAKH